MKNTLIKIISNLFSRTNNQESKENHIPDEPLPEYKERIKISGYTEIGCNAITRSSEHSFQTPAEVLEVLKDENMLWIDEKNRLLGFSARKETIIVPLYLVKGLDIQNILPAKGPGEAIFSVCLPNSKFLILSISPVFCGFDNYADAISKTIGIRVTFAPELYNC